MKFIALIERFLLWLNLLHYWNIEHFSADGPENVDDIYKTWNLEEAAETYTLVCDFDENGNMEYQWYTAQNYSLQKSQYSHVSIKIAV